MLHIKPMIYSSTQSISSLPPEKAIATHYHLLGHRDLGCTELRIFTPCPMVAYTDNADDSVRLCQAWDGRTTGIYVGVNPRPVDPFFEWAPNRWVGAHSYPTSNCAADKDIEWLSTVFIDIDAISPIRRQGLPASPSELMATDQLAAIIATGAFRYANPVMARSGNGTYLVVPIVPVPIDSLQVGQQYTAYYRNLQQQYSSQVEQVRIDNVSNLSRVMRVIGTINKKGTPQPPDRIHRHSCFLSHPARTPSMDIHRQITHCDITPDQVAPSPIPPATTLIIGNLTQLERCHFIRWCRRFPHLVSQPQWFGLITNLACLHGGDQLIHEISSLDKQRYTFSETQQLIDRVRRMGYHPVRCSHLIQSDSGTYGCFRCSAIENCHARAPFEMASCGIAFPK